MRKKIKGFAIVWKNPKIEGNIVEAYDDFEMNDTFSSLKAAKMYLKRYFTKKQWPNYSRDIKVVPCLISYEIPKKKTK